MSHQPPVPSASTSPYPLHPTAHNDGAHALPPRKALHNGSAGATDARPAVSGKMISAAVGIGSAAIVAALLFSRRGKSQTAKPAPRRKSGDDKAKRGQQDRARVSSSEPYEVSYFARKHRISTSEARDILKESGPDRKAANALAKSRQQAEG